MHRTKTLVGGNSDTLSFLPRRRRVLRPLLSSLHKDSGVSNSEHEAELDAAGDVWTKQMWPLPASHLESAREGARHEVTYLINYMACLLCARTEVDACKNMNSNHFLPSGNLRSSWRGQALDN